MPEAFLSLPPLNALRAFEAAARHLNFRIAAQELNVTQGAVAQHIRGLEADLGAKLFDRLPRGLALTDEGRAYAPNIRRAFELISEATLLLRPEPARLTISVTPSFATKWLIPKLPEFVAHNPLVDLRILASQSLSSFQADGVDIAVRQGRPPFGAGLMVDLLFPQQIVAICSPALLPTEANEIATADIQHHVLLHDAHNLWPEFMERALGLKMATEAKRMRFNQTGLAIDAAIAGQGIALASRFLVAADIAAGRLVQPINAEMRGTHDFYVVMPRKQRHPEPTQAVRQWLLDEGDAAGL
ncbi:MULTISPECIES: transcriptional regulator GcvA [unclassified Mesorhizobium]|uniref:transcriptional regulator GcvA n=1 Tax=unclassified Mesorhizobium TaxID=325217 RepID=UPI0003CF4AB6|nr:MULTISPECIES: transcriptional regulator GcvA [unclassified Mesorhizobium]ESW63040.1 LysR family transcriptional regulator [Mesorhizobium sp. LSJC277A00]ESW82773.1 LysR family transcriptional regulator [Mesorhizobium sp. LSJC269B00]ESX11340.1 LysR family transcriptional regulator [Mesorhizobium sp. LSJC264A00]ESX59831.1 LysR family transcriptional regulator [Mesorhizobium sp. LSHC422A00]ESY48831.1 LysR family transcriptional regulator [Mesorhizobium sp. LNJC380A00]